MYQYLFGFKHVLNYLVKYDISYSFGIDYIAQKRIFFPFATANMLGGFLVLIILLILGRKSLYPLLFPITLALFFTKSIGAFFSLFLGLIVYQSVKGRMVRRKFIGILTLATVIILVFILRFYSSQETSRPYLSLNMRLLYWQETLGVIKAHPWMGMGLGNFNLTVSRYAHNFLLQIWAEMGIFGLFAFIWFIVAYFMYIFKNIRKYQDKNQIAGLLGADIAFLAHNLIDFTFFLPEICLIWWTILGLSIDRDG